MTPARRGVGSHGRDGAGGGDVEGDPTGSHCCSVSSGTVDGSSASLSPRQARVDEIYIYIRVGMMEIDQSSFTSVLSVHR